MLRSSGIRINHSVAFAKAANNLKRRLVSMIYLVFDASIELVTEEATSQVTKSDIAYQG